MEHAFVERPSVRLRRPARLLRLASDERLVVLVRDGDEGAFEALYDRHHPAILGFCRHMLGTREEAEDAVQHTFLAAFRDLAGSEKPIDLRPWLFAIARNRCLSLLRARRAHVELDLAEPSTDGLTATVERREDLRELLADLAGLPEDQRAALLLAELGALHHAGIATVLGCPREKVKALVFQARTSLAASREARATPCEQIRLELATASGAALRRGSLRRHLRTCAGCRAFKTEVTTQHKLLALALPVVPTVALKTSVLGGGASAAGAATATTVGAGVSSATNGVFGGVLGTVASSSAGKAAVSLAIAGAVAGGGALTAQHEQRGTAPPTPARSHVDASPAAATAPVAFDAPMSRPRPASAGTTPRRRRTDLATTPVRSLGVSGGGQPSTPPTPPARGGAEADLAPAPPAPLSPPDADGERQGGRAPSSWHGTAQRHAHGVPRGQAKAHHGHDRTARDQAKASPGHDHTPPGQAKTPPGHAKTGQGHEDAPPTGSVSAPGHSGSTGSSTGGGESSHGNSGSSQGNSGSSQGNSGSSQGNSGSSHGHGG